MKTLHVCLLSEHLLADLIPVLQERPDAVLALAHTMRAFGKEHPGLYAAVQTAPDPEDGEWLDAGRGVVEIMIRALSAYKLSTEDAQHSIRMLRIIVDGCIPLLKPM